MPRRPRLCPAGIPQHIVQRGNDRQTCFTNEADFAAYAHCLLIASLKFDVQVHAWVFMTNHVHLLVTPLVEFGSSQMMQHIGRLYVRYFNHTFGRSGTLWEGRFRSSLIQEDAYLLACQRYIELNPVRAGIVTHPADYRWSSYAANGMGKPAKLWTPHSLYLGLGHNLSERINNYRALFEPKRDNALLPDIRFAVNKGLVLGNEGFTSEIAALTSRRVAPLRRGRGGSE